MSNIVIGKHTLESLTSGMYSDPYVIFREYIQNAADSIDSAIQQNIIVSREGYINIQLSPAEHKIVISDNGTGISSQNAEQILISIGNSKKSSESERGFRGIGRLAALGYCSTLTFETSALNEECATRIIIDSNKLSQLLTAKDENDVTITDVLEQVYLTEKYPENASSHYFKVIMDGIEDVSGLNNYDNVIAYISQNAPVPYDPVAFAWGSEIIKRLNNEGLKISEYNISVTYGTVTERIYKPYKDSFLLDKGKNIFDRVQDIEILKFQQNDGTILAIGWLGKISYLGSIYDKTIKGLRLRKGNILIGDYQTLNTIFKDARFNGWSIGEIFVVSNDLIPNARRDNFEKNSVYFILMEQLQKIAHGITKEIRSSSLKRNQELSDALNNSADTAKSAVEAIENGANAAIKSELRQKLSEAQKAVGNAEVRDDSGLYYQEIAFDELDMLIGKMKGVTSFKAINTLDGLSSNEKKILEKVFTAIIAYDESIASSIIDHILISFSKENTNV